MEPLQEMPATAWKEIRDSFKQNWPKHLIAYTFFDTQLRHSAIKAYLHLKIFCPHGDISNGAISFYEKGEGLQLMIFPLKSISMIEDSLVQTKLVDWGKPLMVEAAQEETLRCLQRLSKLKRIIVRFHDRADVHYFSQKNDKFQNLSCPPETYVGNLKPEHLDIVDKTWTYSGNWSRQFFETLMNNDLIYVLYSSKHEPLAWISISTQGSLTHLYCQESHRRKGYAEFVTKYAINKLLEARSEVLGYTVEDNVKSKSLFIKLGFQDVGHVYWTFIEPEKHD